MYCQKAIKKANPARVGERVRRLSQMKCTANIGIVFGMTTKKRKFFASAIIKGYIIPLHPNAHSGYNDFINIHFVGALIFTDSSNLQVYDTVCS